MIHLHEEMSAYGAGGGMSWGEQKESLSCQPKMTGLERKTDYPLTTFITTGTQTEGICGV